MAILEYLEIMIKLDIEEDNSEILEYVLKVAYKFYPMVYEDSKGIMHVGGTKADEEFENYYNKGEVNFLSYNEYLNDEEIQANIKALNLDVDKFYLTYTVHYPCFQRTVGKSIYGACLSSYTSGIFL